MKILKQTILLLLLTAIIAISACGNNGALPTGLEPDNGIQVLAEPPMQEENIEETPIYTNGGFIPTWTSREVDVGNGINSFVFTWFVDLVTTPTTIYIYRIDDLENPHQIITNRSMDGPTIRLEVGDYNFDGYNDFSVLRWRGTANYARDFWLWNSEIEKFVFNESLSGLGRPQFDSETEVISSSWSHGSGEFTHSFFRFIDDEIIPIRRLARRWEHGMAYLLTVHDYQNGVPVEVFRAYDHYGVGGDAFTNFEKWFDLLYFGQYDYVESLPFNITFADVINADIPKMLFEISGYMWQEWYAVLGRNAYIVDLIIIRDYLTGEIIQKIGDFDNDDFHSLLGLGVCGETAGFIVEDVDFDGYKDIRILRSNLGVVNRSYRAWIFNRETNQFVYNEYISEIINLEIDHENQIIHSWERMSAGSSVNSRFRVVDGNITRFFAERLGYSIIGADGNREFIDITFELIDGEWIETYRRPTRLMGG